MPNASGFIRRGAEEYGGALMALLPTGPAWPRDPETVLARAVAGLAAVLGFVDKRAADLLEIEGDPRLTLEMIDDWERAFGLPDPCIGQATTLQERRVRLLQRIVEEGGQSRAFFIALALGLGYRVTISEISPIMGGVSRGGEDHWEAAAPEQRFYWIVNITEVPVWWFRGGVGEGGKDHHAEWAALLDLECLFRRYKPAHTQVIFNYVDEG
jgi:uncharacterized protein YmfQ (DUF2313 family)